MKKQLILLTTIFALLLGNVFSQTVYVTNTGKKYHTENCRYLSKSKISINLSDAKARGYNACSVCNPSANVNQSQPPKTSETQNKTASPNNNSTQSASEQCSATTKAGSQCKRVTKSTNGKCWQHGGN